jgi:hypothetical protein
MLTTERASSRNTRNEPSQYTLVMAVSVSAVVEYVSVGRSDDCDGRRVLVSKASGARNLQAQQRRLGFHAREGGNR